MAKKFRGSFHALTIMGGDYINHQRFKPLKGKGKPLWEFKEHDHRLYCVRIVRGSMVRAVLLYGWVKQKEGKSKEEDRHIEAAISAFKEYLAEFSEEI